MVYSTKEVGSKYSTSYKCYVTQDGKIISPFHDIPLYSGSFVNVVNEIPRFELAKFEISKSEEYNPVVQDIKNNKPRFVKSIYPSYGYPFNYGALPQTWEDPKAQDEHTGILGDNDPVDIIDIGIKRKSVGEVYQAKVLGALALLDDNETDWKIMVIDIKDEMADQINDIGDVEKVYPGLVENAVRWFRDYKVPDNKPKNNFALNGEFKNADFAKSIIKSGHESWKNLMKTGYNEISLCNSTLKGESGFSANDFEPSGALLPETPISDDIKVFSFVKN